MKIRKSYIAAIHDTSLAALSFVLSSYLRLGERFPSNDPNIPLETALFSASCLTVFWSMKIFRTSWSYTSVHDILNVAKAVTLSTLVFLPIIFMFTRLEGLSRSILVINWFILILLLSASRFSYRLIKTIRNEKNGCKVPLDKKIPVILIGINDQSEHFLHDTVRNRNSSYRIVAILDNDPDQRGRYICNVKIYGDINSLDKVVRKLKEKGKPPQKIIIAPDVLDVHATAHLFDIAESLGLTISRLPKITDFKHIREEKEEIKPIAIEDLLGRPQTVLNRESMKALVHGKKVLITGAGGTIGGELTRQIASYSPSILLLLDNSEHNLYQIDLEMSENFPLIPRKSLIGDIRNTKRLESVFSQEKPELVFHAAALKHVPIAEMNPSEAISINIIGTINVANACVKHKVAEMVMISTDKAVRPCNIMGATKRLAEKYVLAAGQSGKATNTKMVAVRFGNVLDSTGSVIPLFRRQLAKGGPLTVTHPDITRYFMTVREAVELVLQASAMALSSPNFRSGIFVLDMGNPVRIKDLAEQMIRLGGLRPYTDIKIEYTGLRPGEKLYEELFYPEENPKHTEVEGIMISSPGTSDLPGLGQTLREISEYIKKTNNNEIFLREELLPEFVH